MTFTETNDSDDTVDVPIGPSIDGFTITSGGKMIWRSNSGVEPDFVYIDHLTPGESITLTAEWTASLRDRDIRGAQPVGSPRRLRLIPDRRECARSREYVASWVINTSNHVVRNVSTRSGDAGRVKKN